MKPCAYLKKQKLSPNISGQWLLTEWTQQIFTCSTSAKETSKYEINLKSTVKTLQKCQWRINDIVLVSLLLIFNIFYTVSIADFEQVNTWWEIKFNKLFRLQSGLIIMSDKKAWGSEFCLILCGLLIGIYRQNDFTLLCIVSANVTKASSFLKPNASYWWVIWNNFAG